jgi:hypothetical protein
MCRIKAVGIAAVVLALSGMPVPAAAQDREAQEILSRLHAHARPHITVHPLAQSYPGSEAVRQCASWLATEHRPSGTVIVPRQHCWWERG